MKSEIFTPLIEEAYKFAQEVTNGDTTTFDGVFLGKYTELLLQRTVDICLNMRDPTDSESRPGENAAQVLIKYFDITDTSIAD